MWSYSRGDTCKRCPRSYFFKYIQGLKTYPISDCQDARLIGNAIHDAIAEGGSAIDEYLKSIPIANDLAIEEAIKLAVMGEKVREIIPLGEFEVPIKATDGDIEFTGFIDLLVKDGDVFDIYDFKYSNNIDNYLNSEQLHLYKHFYELETGNKVRSLFFVFIPKTQIRLKKTETVGEFRLRLKKELETKTPFIQEVVFSSEKVESFKNLVKTIEKTPKSIGEFPKNESRLCDYCDFKDYCLSDGKNDLSIDWEKTLLNIANGGDILDLPKNERKAISVNASRRIWIYGVPFSGKTHLANEFPDPLFLNTDGNVKFIDAPSIVLRDNVEKQRHLDKKTFAWDDFKEILNELEKKDNTFKTIVIDLIDDLYESCRLSVFDKNGIEHESDSGYGKGWDLVKTEFLSTFRRLMTLDYENIVIISHEDTTKDLTKKGGDKVSLIKPNIPDKIALKMAGMVDLVARIINDDGNRSINFKNSENIFGGGRLNVLSNTCPCTYHGLETVYKNSYNGEKIRKVVIPDNQGEMEEKPASQSEEQPTRRKTKRRSD